MKKKNGPYVSGPTLTRDFGPNNPYADNDDNNFLKGTVTGLSAFGVANSAKENLIEQTAKSALKGTADESLSGTKAVSKAFGKDVGRYFKYVKGAGVAGAAVSSGVTVYSAADYYINGGTSLKVGAKAALDVTMTAIGFCGPIGFGVSAAYFLLDVSFGDQLWNLPNENQINDPMPESKP